MHNLEREIAREVAQAKERLFEQWMTRLLPPICIRWAKERKHLAAIARFAQKRGIHTKLYPDGREVLCHGNKELAEFKVSFKQI